MRIVRECWIWEHVCFRMIELPDAAEPGRTFTLRVIVRAWLVENVRLRIRLERCTVDGREERRCIVIRHPAIGERTLCVGDEVEDVLHAERIVFGRATLTRDYEVVAREPGEYVLKLKVVGTSLGVTIH